MKQTFADAGIGWMRVPARPALRLRRRGAPSPRLPWCPQGVSVRGGREPPGRSGAAARHRPNGRGLMPPPPAATAAPVRRHAGGSSLVPTLGAAARRPVPKGSAAAVSADFSANRRRMLNIVSVSMVVAVAPGGRGGAGAARQRTGAPVAVAARAVPRTECAPSGRARRGQPRDAVADRRCGDEPGHGAPGQRDRAAVRPVVGPAGRRRRSPRHGAPPPPTTTASTSSSSTGGAGTTSTSAATSSCQCRNRCDNRRRATSSTTTATSTP